MPFVAEYLNASFGSSRTGIGTVGYTLMKNDGTVSVARATAGVVEEGGGVYGKANIPILDDSASILWDTGGGTPLYAAEDLEPARKQAELEAKLPAGNIASPGDEMALVDDAITSAKHDEATSFPLAQDDAGASEVARTGADGDTLETLSDQIDPKAIEANVQGHATDALNAYDPPTHAEMTAEHDVLEGEHVALSGEHSTIDANVLSRESEADAATRQTALLLAIAALPTTTDIADVIGLVGENVQWSNLTHDTRHNLTGARITQYTDNTLVTPRKSWDLTATYDVDNELTAYDLVEV